MLHLSRRQFLKGSTSGHNCNRNKPSYLGGGSPGDPFNQIAQLKNQHGMYSCRGRGGAHIDTAASQNFIAICDVQQSAMDKVREKHPNVQMFTDYRKLFDKVGKEVDAVFIATPDHNHAAASMLALNMVRPVIQKSPLHGP